MTNVRTQVLEDASSLINGQRESDYGEPIESFSAIAEMWSAYTGHSIAASDVCHMMALLKIARLSNGAHRDSSNDACGYLALGAECERG